MIPDLGRSPGEGNHNPLQLQYSCLGHPMARGAWGAAVHGVAKDSDTTERLNNDLLNTLGILKREDMILTNISSHLSYWTWTSLVYLTHGCLPSSLDSQRGLEVPKSTAKTHKSLISHRNQNGSLLGVPSSSLGNP